jgi:CheY-like chemotaxis protein
MANIVWMQTGACSGESMALLCADRPSIENLVEHYGLNFLWHPSLTAEHRFGDVLDALLSGREKLDILCIEGSLMTGPNGSGQYDTWKGRAKIDIVRQLAPLASHVVALTAGAQEHDREQSLAAGMSAYVTKPVDLEKLLRLIAGPHTTAERPGRSATATPRRRRGGRSPAPSRTARHRRGRRPGAGPQ